MSLKRIPIRWAKQLAGSFGYDVTALWQLETRPLAHHLRDLFNTYNIDCVFDVGANRGQYYDLLRNQVGYEGIVFSFEPVRKYAETLHERAKTDSNWRIFDVALGSFRRSASINVTWSPGLNSFLTPKDQSLVVASEVVQIETLDNIFDDLRNTYGFHAPYLKLDTQGYDLEVLGGSRNSVSSVAALQTEASIQHGYQGMPDFQDTLNRFLSLEFEISGMFPVWHDAALRLHEFDCIMINRRFAEAVLQGGKNSTST